MKFCIITFRSVTPAQRGEGVLKRAGMECSVQRTPKWMEEQGCGYSLRVGCDILYQALEFLQTHGVAYKKAYSILRDGTVEEMQL